MNRYYSNGGAKDPGFPHKVSVSSVSIEMIAWCENCTSYDDFERYYIIWSRFDGGPAFTFETAEHAIIFRLRWG